MLIIPAIDLKGGACVRLRQGRMREATVFSDDPVATAQRWLAAGCRRLHLVDLDGAFAGKPVHGEAVAEIAAACPGLPVQIGGGIRELATIERYLKAGARFVILGTRAVREPAFVGEACREFPGSVIVALDARDGRVATDGWAETGALLAEELARRFEDAGVSAIVYTDIARDGMLEGVNVAATAALAQATGIPVIASGGVAGMEDIRALAAVARHGVCGAVAGRALYEGSLDLASAQRLADQLAGARG